ncbi:MAG TPA: tetratricopeptide repeat protein [Xanthobacteraceae bacterium]|nr:tetratricopeptide repeat protein [Xanthobacteraceae bacterium]
MQYLIKMLHSALKLQNQGKLAEAEKLYSKVLEIDSGNFDALHLLGLLRHQHGDRTRGLELVGAALKVNPNSAEALSNYGSILCALNRQQEALPYFERALAINPFFASALNNRGNALDHLERHEEALECFKRALTLKPGDPQTLFNCGYALRQLNRHREALGYYEQFLKRLPSDSTLLNNCGKELALLGRSQDALACFDRSLQISPDDIEAHWQSALSRLTLGDLARGWKAYEWRWRTEEFPSEPRHTALPRWNGKDIGGTLLAWAEQGLGDEILYASMIPDLAGRVGALALEVEPRLVPLFARSFPDARIIARDDPLPEVAAQIPFASLGQFLRPDSQSFPKRERGYLAADAERAAALRRRLSPQGEKVVGLSWISKNPVLGKAKTATLAAFGPLLRMPHCRYVDLQYGDTAAEREDLQRRTGIHVERLDDIDNTQDIDGLAALIAACDLVVTVSNTTAHLAGALGKATVVFVPFGTARIWYWFHEGDDSPWYPRVRVKRQRQGQTWDELIASAATEIGEFASGDTQPQPA